MKKTSKNQASPKGIPESSAISHVDESNDETDDGGLLPDEKDSLEELDERTENEKKMFEIISSGKLKDAKEFHSSLSEDSQVDTNSRDLLGHNLVTHAVECGSLKMVRFVLRISNTLIVDTKDAILHAVKDNLIDILLLLLEFEDFRYGSGEKAVAKQMKAAGPLKQKHLLTTANTSAKVHRIAEIFDQTEFGNDITPLMMAAKCGHYEIIQILYERGERLPKFHAPSCSCSNCRWATRDIEKTLRRVNLLEAMANPIYMMFMASQDGHYDPVPEVYKLTKIVDNCIKEEPEYSDQYGEILLQLERLPCHLLTLCRNCEESKLFLSQRDNYVGPQNTLFPRLAMALELGHGNFVAHPNIQFLVQSEFYGDVWKYQRSTMEKILKFAAVLAVMVFFPVIQIFLWFSLLGCGGSRVVRFLKSPWIKAMSKFASHIMFAVLLFMMNIEYRPEADSEPQTMYIRWIVIIYVASLSLSLFRRFLLHPRIFYKCFWNLYDMFTLAAFWATFFFWDYLFYRKLMLGHEETRPRRRLPRNDPLLICECLFAIASVFAMVRIIQWFLLWPFTGQFMTGLYDMLKQRWQYIIIVLWLCLSLSLSAQIIFRPYRNLTNWDPKELKNKTQRMVLSDPIKMVAEYFEGGEIEPDHAEILKVNRSWIDDHGHLQNVEHEHETTQWFATFYVIMWNVVGHAFMHDALNGLMAATRVGVRQAKDIMYKNIRVHEMLYYIHDGHLAPPFNLIPNGACLAGICRWMSGCLCSKTLQAGCNLTECCYIRDIEKQEEMEEKQRKGYPLLLTRLFQRYLQANGKVEDFFEEEEEEDTGEEVDKEEEDDEGGKAQKADVEDVQEQVKEIKELVKKWLEEKEGKRK